MKKSVVKTARYLIVAVLGAGFALGGYTDLNESKPMAMWLPQFAVGASFVLSYLLWEVGERLDSRSDPAETTARGWAFLIGFSLWLAAGGIFIFLGWMTLLVKVYTGMGAIGVLVAIYAMFHNEVSTPASH